MKIFSKIFKKAKAQRMDADLAALRSAGAKETQLSFPLPMVVLSSSLDIVWYNSLFSDAVGKIAPFGTLVKTELEKVSPANPNVDFIIEINNKRFNVVGKLQHLPKSADFSITLYLIDRTEEHELAQKLADERAVVCWLMVDNYDDLMKSIADHQDAGGKTTVSSIAAGIEGLVQDWAEKLEANYIKYEKDRYCLTFRNDKLEAQIADKFSYFELFDELNKERHLPVTISAGIGISGEALAKSSEFARAALDMALGRGGDQIVVRDESGFSYFGGRSLEVEKRTKVKPRLVADALVKLLPHNENVFIMGHKNADADSIGACAGLAALMRAKNLPANIILDEKTCTSPEIIEMLKQSGIYDHVFIPPEFALEIFQEGDLLILVDFHKPSLAECPELIERKPHLVLLDHHRRDSEFIENATLTYHEPYVSSTSEMVVEILQYIDSGISLLPEEVQALYAGLVLDTRNFEFKTGVRTFEAASYLRTLGADTIATKRLFQMELNDLIRRAKAISQTEMYRDSFAFAVLENESNKPLIGHTADAMLNIKNVDATFALCQIGDVVSISARSLGGINVQIIAETLGGGGHATSAGAQVIGTVDKVIPKIKKLIDQALD